MSSNDYPICDRSGYTVSHDSWDKNSIGGAKAGHMQSLHGEVKVWTKEEIAALNKERK